MKTILDSNVLHSNEFLKLSEYAKLCYINLLFFTDLYGFTIEINFSKDKFYNDYVRPEQVKELIDNDLIILFKSNIICIKDYFLMNKFNKRSTSFHLKELMMTFLNDEGRYCIKNEYLKNVEFLEDVNEFELLGIPTEEEIIEDYEQEVLSEVDEEDLAF